MKEKLYICTNCGNKIEDLFKQLGGVALKLTKCENCDFVADPYLEYDLINIIIDLILLKIVAMRHFLYNSTYKNLWKLSLVLLLLESYSKWAIINKESCSNENKTIPIIPQTELYLDDLRFYNIFSTVLVHTSLLILINYTFTTVYTMYNRQPSISLFLVWKAMTLSNCSIFLMFPALIWDIDVYDVHIHFIYMYSTVSQLLNYKALSNSGKLWSFLVIFLSYALKNIVVYGMCLFQLPWLC